MENIETDRIQEGISTKYCIRCRERGFKKIASFFCPVHNETYCDACKHHHVLQNENCIQQNTIMNEFDGQDCEPCPFLKRNNRAIYFCKDCSERLCEDCRKAHMKQNHSKSHIITELQNHILCQPCHKEGKQTQAVMYCRNCSNPEPFCESCAEYHLSMKTSRNHQLSNNISEIPNMFGFNPLNKMNMFKKDDKEEGGNDMSDNVNRATPYQNQSSEVSSKGHSSSTQSVIHQRNQIEDSPLNRIAYNNSCNSGEKFANAVEGNDDQMQRVKYSKETHRREGVMQTNKLHSQCSSQDTPNEQTNKILNACVHLIGEPSDVNSDEINLHWETYSPLQNNERFKVQYKQHPSGSWKMFGVFSKPSVVVNGLQPNTCYKFRVRIVNEEQGQESKQAESDETRTNNSPAAPILKISNKVRDGMPTIYSFPFQESKKCRNDTAKTRKFFLPDDQNITSAKNILFVGASGSGKSTLINAMANYIMGVTWTDNFRFTLTNDQELDTNQATSQTEWISCYRIYNPNCKRVSSVFNLIDTPGFGDTRGIAQDKKIRQQLFSFFHAGDKLGLTTIDAVCFVLKAPDARLTETQNYILASILELFGNDIAENLCTVITFADNDQPPVIAALQETGKYFKSSSKKYFVFNNSSLYEDHKKYLSNSLSARLWHMGFKSFEKLFTHIMTLPPKCERMSAKNQLLKMRMENYRILFDFEIEFGLLKICDLNSQITTLRQQKQNKTMFDTEVNSIKYEKCNSFKPGEGYTCLQCEQTCQLQASDHKFRSECPTCKCNCLEHYPLPFELQIYNTKMRYKANAREFDEFKQNLGKKITCEKKKIYVLIEMITLMLNEFFNISLYQESKTISTEQIVEELIEIEKYKKTQNSENLIRILCKLREKIHESFPILITTCHNDTKELTKKEFAKDILKLNNVSEMLDTIDTWILHKIRK